MYDNSLQRTKTIRTHTRTAQINYLMVLAVVNSLSLRTISAGMYQSRLAYGTRVELRPSQTLAAQLFKLTDKQYVQSSQHGTNRTFRAKCGKDDGQIRINA